MLCQLVAYDAANDVVGVQSLMAARDANGAVVGVVDFEAHELAGDKLRDIWDVQRAIGSGAWPEWLGSQTFDFRVELGGGRITALIHKVSGYRRDRAAIAAAIAQRIQEQGDGADLRDLVGGPTRPLLVDAQGHTDGTRVIPPELPMIGQS
jgi:hypothetical protein